MLFYWVAAYNKALEDAVAVLDKIAMTVDVKDRKFVTFVFLINLVSMLKP